MTSLRTYSLALRWAPIAFLAGCAAPPESATDTGLEAPESHSAAQTASRPSTQTSVATSRPQTGTAKTMRGREVPFELVEGEPMFTLLDKDRIPSIDAPEFVSAADAAAFMKPDETVLGVVGKDGTTKCYSAWHLDHHEIVNDTLDGHSIAATW